MHVIIDKSVEAEQFHIILKRERERERKIEQYCVKQRP